jgi:hypothetical protein
MGNPHILNSKKERLFPFYRLKKDSVLFLADKTINDQLSPNRKYNNIFLTEILELSKKI